LAAGRIGVGRAGPVGQARRAARRGIADAIRRTSRAWGSAGAVDALRVGGTSGQARLARRSRVSHARLAVDARTAEASVVADIGWSGSTRRAGAPRRTIDAALLACETRGDAGAAWTWVAGAGHARSARDAEAGTGTDCRIAAAGPGGFRRIVQAPRNARRTGADPQTTDVGVGGALLTRATPSTGTTGADEIDPARSAFGHVRSVDAARARPTHRQAALAHTSWVGRARKRGHARCAVATQTEVTVAAGRACENRRPVRTGSGATRTPNDTADARPTRVRRAARALVALDAAAVGGAHAPDSTRAARGLGSGGVDARRRPRADELSGHAQIGVGRTRGPVSAGGARPVSANEARTAIGAVGTSGAIHARFTLCGALLDSETARRGIARAAAPRFAAGSTCRRATRGRTSSGSPTWSSTETTIACAVIATDVVTTARSSAGAGLVGTTPAHHRGRIDAKAALEQAQ
jgi:hypothetical protein